MTYYIFLDDERVPTDVTWKVLPKVTWKIARNHREFCNLIHENGLPIFVTFDHDLADFHYEVMLKDNDPEIPMNYGEEKTGFDCAKFLVDYCIDNSLKFPDYEVHSKNPIGSKRIVNYVESAKKHSDI